MEPSNIPLLDSLIDPEHYKTIDGASVYTDNERPTQFYSSALKCYKEKLFTDTTVVIEGAQFHAHRLVLVSLSDYFKSLIKMDQGKDGLITLNSVCRPDTFETILNYAYSGELHLTNDNVQEILTAANYFSLEFVQTSCEKFMVENLDVENVCDVIQLARQLSLPLLLNKAEKFLCFKFKIVSQTSGFFTLDASYLIDLIERNDLVLYDNSVILKNEDREEYILIAVLLYISNMSPINDLICEKLLKAVRLPIIPEHRVIEITKSFRKIKELNVLDVIFETANVVRNSKETEQIPDDVKIPQLWLKPRELAAWRITHYSKCFASTGNLGSIIGPPDFIHNSPSVQISKIELWSRVWNCHFRVSHRNVPIKVIGGIAITYRTSSSEQLQRSFHGDIPDDWERQEVILEPGEFITKVRVGAGWLIDSLRFETNIGRTFGPFGEDGGKVEEVRAPEGELSYLYDINSDSVDTQGAQAVYNVRFRWITFE